MDAKTITKGENKHHLLILKKNNYQKIIKKLKINKVNIINDVNYIGIKN